MLRLGAEAWVLIDMPGLSLRYAPILYQIDPDNICLLGGNGRRGYLKDGVLISAKTGALVRLIYPACTITFDCRS